MEETNLVKPTDKALFGRVSESPGRNASELTGGLDRKQDPEAEPSVSGRRQHGLSQSDCGGRSLWRGGRGSTVTRTCQATGETLLVPERNFWSKVGSITVNSGK